MHHELFHADHVWYLSCHCGSSSSSDLTGLQASYHFAEDYIENTLDIGKVVAQIQNHVELLKVTVRIMMSALVISYVEQTTAFLHFHQVLTAAMTPLQVHKNNSSK